MHISILNQSYYKENSSRQIQSTQTVNIKWSFEKKKRNKETEKHIIQTEVPAAESAIKKKEASCLRVFRSDRVFLYHTLQNIVSFISYI